MFAILHNILISSCYLRLTKYNIQVFFNIIKLCLTFHYLIVNSEYLDCTKNIIKYCFRGYDGIQYYLTL